MSFDAKNKQLSKLLADWASWVQSPYAGDASKLLKKARTLLKRTRKALK
jgi:hypothetical protein